MSESIFFKEGKFLNFKGAKREDNPFPKSSKEYEEWDKGWQKGEQERIKVK